MAGVRRADSTTATIRAPVAATAAITIGLVKASGYGSMYTEDNRIGDHIWWISDLAKFSGHYPAWNQQFDVPAILREIYEANCERWTKKVVAL